MKDALGTVKVVDNSVVAHSKPISGDSLHAMMRVAVQCHSQTINAGFDSGLETGGKFEEVSVEVARIDLERGAH
jgi:hypothetical protein